jgi:hypothetical protein
MTDMSLKPACDSQKGSQDSRDSVGGGGFPVISVNQFHNLQAWKTDQSPSRRRKRVFKKTADMIPTNPAKISIVT